MNRDNDKNLHDEMTGFDLPIVPVPPDDNPEGGGQEDAKKKRSPIYTGIGFWLAVFGLVIVLLASFPNFPPKQKQPGTEHAESEDTEMTYVTEAEKDTEDEQIPTKTTEHDEPPAAETEPETQDSSWQETIFGKEGKTVITAPIRVKGLTENERVLTGFRESDFIRGLSSFLTGNNIHVAGITFEGSIALSSGDGGAYTAKLDGISDRKLIVIYFPVYPGKYLFALENVQKEKETERPRETERTPAPETQAPVQPVPSPSSQESTAGGYDAMSLSVKGLPSEVANYMANTYELQYELYDYLFRHGVKNAKTATVTDYYIDSDERTATIQFRVEGSGNVTAVYDRDQNSYSFR